jgi:nuclear pore complex protein Nup85
MSTQLAVRRLDCSVSFCLILFIVIIGSHQFSNYALEIAPSVQELQTQSSVQGIFVHRLIFAVRFARYHQLIEKQEYQEAASDLMAIFVEEVAPISWWAVVLCDSVQLLCYGKFK